MARGALTVGISPKPDIPPPSTYEAPEAPLRDLGPPPPGYGRYADFGQDRFGAGGGGGGFGGSGGGSGGAAGAPRRNLDDVLCFKVRIGLAAGATSEADAHGSAGRRGTMRTSAATRTCLGTEAGWTGPPAKGSVGTIEVLLSGLLAPIDVVRISNAIVVFVIVFP